MDQGRLAFKVPEIRRTVEGREKETVEFLMQEQYLDSSLWKKFVNQFRERVDGDTKGWRGEFWGKSMRGAAMIYAAFRDEALYRALTDSVRDMLSSADPDGKVTSYGSVNEYRVWDVWCRKYVMLGMEYYYDICREEALKERIVSFLTAMADDILRNVGKEAGKVPITDSGCWKGLNSASILEPMVKLYRLSGEKRFLDFASYIVGEGAADGIDIFRFAYDGRLMPYQYGVTKAYEMMSCFEGLYEYYLVTGEEKYRETVIRFGEAVLRSEVTVIGSIGLTHELFDHGRVRQTAEHTDVVQETCVTVTWMKLLARLLKLTGDAKYADEIEKSWFNAYLGAVNTEKKNSPYPYDKFVRHYGCPVLKTSFLPFDSYSPITALKRGLKVGGTQMFSDGSYFGCCAAIGGAGVGVYLNHALLQENEGIAVCLYENGRYEFTWQGEPAQLSIRTDYPIGEEISLTLRKDSLKPMRLKLRLPGWLRSYRIDGVGNAKTTRDGWIEVHADVPELMISLHFDMAIETERPERWTEDVVVLQKLGMPAAPTHIWQTPEELDYIAWKRGPIVFAMDERLTENIEEFVEPDFCTVQFEDGKNDKTCASVGIRPDGLIRMKTKDGREITLVNYASAGKDWESRITAWMHVKSDS